MALKQVIVWRGDLKEIPVGKKQVQSGHAGHIFLNQRVKDNCLTRTIVLTEKEVEWFLADYPKIVLWVKNLKDLMTIHDKAVELGIQSNVITDIGRTVFPEPTVTCLSLGPDNIEIIDRVTGSKGPLGKLKLA